MPQSIDEHIFTSADRLFLDANVWIYIYSPRETEDMYKLKEVYSAAFSRMLAAQSNLFTDVLIISEFVNTYARTQYNTHISKKKRKRSSSTNVSFKEYRKSKQFKPVARQIAITTKRIISECQVLESGFSQLQHDSLLSSYATGNFDFNDQVFATLCQSEKLTLVTNDSDFGGGHKIPILTAHPKLLKQKH